MAAALYFCLNCIKVFCIFLLKCETSIHLNLLFLSVCLYFSVRGRLGYFTAKDRPSWRPKLWKELFGELDPGQRGVCHQREDFMLLEAGHGGRTVALCGGHSRLVV